VAILCGRGRAFCSGADVHQRQLRSREEFERLSGPQVPGANAASLLFQTVNWKPVAAAVHGYVLGHGLGMALDCDLIVAEAWTPFQLTETSRGLGAAKHWEAGRRWGPRSIERREALGLRSTGAAKHWAQFHFRGAGAFGDEVSLTGRYFTTEEALAANVINRVAPKDLTLEVAISLAQAVAANPPLSVRATVRTRRWLLDR
jgi:enoyl-CoA hydratase/carnithine racemase